MKTCLIILFTLFLPAVTWMGSFKDAAAEAAKSHKLILVNFSGSDWCGPCIRLRKEILESAVFENYAAEKLVLVRADFPRQKKNQLSKAQTQLNETLADQYNPEGKFPFTLLVDEQGKILKTWDGFPDVPPAKFVEELRSVTKK